MEPQHIIALVVYVAIAIYLIVEAETVGQATGYVRGGYVDKPTPGCMIRFFGCAMLAVGPGALFAFAVGAWWAGVLVGLAAAVGLYVLANRVLPI